MIYVQKKKVSKRKKITLITLLTIFVLGIILFFTTLSLTYDKEQRELKKINSEICTKYNLICKDIYVNYNKNPYYFLVNNTTTKVYDKDYKELGFYNNNTLYSIDTLKKEVKNKYGKVIAFNYYYDKKLMYEFKALTEDYYHYAYYDANNGKFIRTYKIKRGR